MRVPLVCLTLLLALASGAPFMSPTPAISAPLASAPKPGTIAVATAHITYFAQAGDTLLSIAHRFTNRRENWLALSRLNRIGKDSSIPIGTAVIIPVALLTDDPVEANVVALSGNVTAATRGGAPVVLGIGSQLAEGVQIDTGNNSFLTISLPDASRISLPSNSRIRLVKLRMVRYTKSPRTELLLLRGRVESRVAPLEPNKGRFEVRTPYSVAGVRGTHFRVNLMGDSVANEVLDGRVTVGKLDKPNALTLASAKGNIVNTQAAGPAVDLLPPPRILAPETQHEYAAAQFVLTPVADADEYHVQISTDQDGQNIIAESRARQPSLKVDGLRDGDYFARVSAIDRTGLEGLTRTQPFSLKTHAEVPPRKSATSNAPYVEQSDKTSITLRWAVRPGKSFNLQVARDADFTWLIHTASTDASEMRIPRPDFGTYFARVQAINADGSANPFSKAQPFIVTDHWVINDGNPVRAKDAQ